MNNIVYKEMELTSESPSILNALNNNFATGLAEMTSSVSDTG